jgi:hypothetical protein
MKAIVVLTLLSTLTAGAQPPPQDKPSDVSDPTRGRVELRSETRPAAGGMERERKVSGAAAQARRVKNPLKLIDPRAPHELGDGYANVSRDPITGQAHGIRLVTISF